MRVDQFFRQQRGECDQRRRGIAAGIGDAGRAFDLLGKDVGQAVRPAFDVAMVAADVDDAGGVRDARQRLLRFAGGERGKEDVKARQFRRVPFLDNQFGEFSGDAGETVDEFLPSGGFSGSVDQIECGVARAEA